MAARLFVFVITLGAAAAPIVGLAADSTLAESPTAQVAARLAEPSDVDAAAQATAATAAQGVLLFSMTGPDTARCVRGFDDVTGDGVPEVIASYDESGEPNVFCIDGTSRGTPDVVWSFQPTGGASGGAPYGDDALTMASDSDGNTYPNLLVGTAWGGRTGYALDGFGGTEIWRFDTYLEPDSGWVYSLAEMDDISGDDTNDAIVGAGSDNDHLYAVSGAGQIGQATKLWSYAVVDPWSESATSATSTATATTMSSQ